MDHLLEVVGRHSGHRDGLHRLGYRVDLPQLRVRAVEGLNGRQLARAYDVVVIRTVPEDLEKPDDMRSLRDFD